MPRWYIGSILRHVDFLASDVPGVPVPVFLGGARVLTAVRVRPDDRLGGQCHAAHLRRHVCAGHRRRHRRDTRLRRLLRVPRRRLRRSAGDRGLTGHHALRGFLAPDIDVVRDRSADQPPDWRAGSIPTIIATSFHDLTTRQDAFLPAWPKRCRGAMSVVMA